MLSNSQMFSLAIGRRVLNSELVEGGAVPVFSANVFEPFGYVDAPLFEDFSRDSILWGIDGDWMVNFYPKGKPFYPTDHCGVLRVLTDKVNPRYMARILEVEGQKMKFSRSYRASLERVQGITFMVPDIESQNAVVADVEVLENKIAEAEERLRELDRKKERVLRHYLE